MYLLLSISIAQWINYSLFFIFQVFTDTNTINAVTLLTDHYSWHRWCQNGDWACKSQSRQEIPWLFCWLACDWIHQPLTPFLGHQTVTQRVLLEVYFKIFLTVHFPQTLANFGPCFCPRCVKCTRSLFYVIPNYKSYVTLFALYFFMLCCWPCMY